MTDQVLVRRKILKAKLNNRQSVFAGWTSMGHVSITEMLCCSGVDFIGIDLEHSTISLDEAQQIIGACHAQGVACLPRISSHNAEMARRLLDSGADGLIVPMVQSPIDVGNMVAWAKYPPVGQRGFGVARAQQYGFNFDHYTKEWNDSSILIAQIESVSAVNSIDQILENMYLDGVMVGPYDISGSLNVPGQIEHQLVVEAGLKVVEAAKKHGKACATQLVQPNKEKIRQAIERGYTLMVLASDVFILWKWAEGIRRDIDSL